jgi:hypothetical protein
LVKTKHFYLIKLIFNYIIFKLTLFEKENEMPKKNVELTFDHDRSVEVCTFLAQAWRERKKHFALCQKPEVISIPSEVEIGSRLHRLYLHAFAQLNRYGNSSNRAMDLGAKLFLENPWLIDPEIPFKSRQFRPLMVGVMGFVSTTTDKGQREGRRRLRGWIENLKLLKSDYDSDPVNIFLQSQRNRECLIEEFSRFYGFAHKVAQLATVWFQEIEWLDNQEDWLAIKQIPAVPVDMWASRLVNNFGIVTAWSSDHREDVARIISDYYVDICVENAINWCDLSQANWHIGTNICQWVPKRNPRTYCYNRCPAYDFCVGRTSGALHINGNKGFLKWADRGCHELVLPEFKPKNISESNSSPS